MLVGFEGFIAAYYLEKEKMYWIHHAHIEILGYIQCSLDNTQRQEGHSFGFWMFRMTLKSENEMNDIRHFFRFVPKPRMLNQVT